jgi:hypothetical protein
MAVFKSSLVSGQVIGTGTGPNKTEAKQAAARQALEYLVYDTDISHELWADFFSQGVPTNT